MVGIAPVVTAVAVVALAAASLALPWEPVYDPWGWLVWGREAAALELDTTGGPSWKPLPVVFTTPFSLVPGAAPELWVFVARVGWLAAAAGAGLLAARVAGRADGRPAERFAAAGLAVLGVVLLHDAFTPWLRQFAGGLAEPLLVALVLFAVERGLADRHGQALALGTAAALIRPEAWPFLLLYAGWLWRRGGLAPAPAALALVPLVVVPVLWFVPDLIASGSIFTGADRAREGSGSPPMEALEVLGRAALLPLAALWAGFAVALAGAHRARDRPVMAVGLGALSWIALVAAMAAAGYAGLPRFLAPAAGVVCALGAAGLAHLAVSERPAVTHIRGTPGRSLGVAGVALLGVAFVVQAAFRVADLPDAARTATALGESQRDLAVLTRDPALAGCRPVAIGAIEGQTALAWWLEIPIGDVDVGRARPSAGAHVVRDATGWRLAQGCGVRAP